MSDIKEGLKLPVYQILTRYLNPRSRYYYCRFLKTNGRHIEILLPVLIWTYSLLSACDSALAYQILCKLDDRLWSYDIILILQDGGHSVANLLLVSGLATSEFSAGLKLLASEFRPDISIHCQEITTSRF